MKTIDPVSAEMREFYRLRTLKSSATKLAKRVPLKCLSCGKTWMEKPSHAWRQYCSALCAGNFRKHPGVKACEICGAEFYVKSSTKRKKACSARCARELHKRAMRETGHSWQKFRSEEKWLASIQSDANRKRTSLLHKGRVRTSDTSRRNSPAHIRALHFYVRTPQGIVHRVDNVCAFVSEHPDLFDSDDLVCCPSRRTSFYCRATTGFYSIASGRRGVWKGWMRVSKIEGEEMVDLIQRKPIPLPAPAASVLESDP